MAYLVTGAAGFIGARFVESCHDRGIPVISVDRRKHFADRREHAGLKFGEIVDRDELMSWLKSGPSTGKTQIKAIVHMGACSNTMETDEAYLRKVNVEYSQMLWNFATERKIPFVYASSAATYGDGSLGYHDNDSEMGELHPLNLYGESKLKFDLWALEQEKKGSTPPSWSGFKFFNVYGFGERHKLKMASVVLHSFDQIRRDGWVRLFKSHKEGIADGHQKRDFVYVDDVIQVLHFALNKPIGRGIYNLGSGQARTFLDLTRAVFRAMGAQEKIEFIDTPEQLRDKYQYYTQAPMGKLKAELYHHHFTSLEDGVAKYVSRLAKG